MAVVGLGHELRGDDDAGLEVAAALQRYASETLLVVAGGHAPENCTGPIRRFAPDLALLVDAAEMGEPPGTVRWLSWGETTGLSATTHTMPPYLLARYLEADPGCEVALLGIQPLDNSLGAPLSPAVRRAVRQVVRGITRTIPDGFSRSYSAGNK